MTNIVGRTDRHATTDATLSRTLGVVVTGGTLGSRLGDRSTVVVESNEPPEWPLVLRAANGAGLRVIYAMPFRMPSEEIQPVHWLAVAHSCRTLIAQGADGVVVLHGTDTAAYTAAALSLLLADVSCPVAITGANVPPGLASSDAMTNIAGSIQALRHLTSGVVLAFAGKPRARTTVHSGTHVRKTSRDGMTFESINAPPLGYIEGTDFVRFAAENESREHDKHPKLRFASSVESRVLLALLSGTRLPNSSRCRKARWTSRRCS